MTQIKVTHKNFVIPNTLLSLYLQSKSQTTICKPGRLYLNLLHKINFVTMDLINRDTTFPLKKRHE